MSPRSPCSENPIAGSCVRSISRRSRSARCMRPRPSTCASPMTQSVLAEWTSTRTCSTRRRGWLTGQRLSPRVSWWQILLPPHRRNHPLPPHHRNHLLPPHRRHHLLPPHHRNHLLPPHHRNHLLRPHRRNRNIQGLPRGRCCCVRPHVLSSRPPRNKVLRLGFVAALRPFPGPTPGKPARVLDY
jgi:hypothetical protein